MSKQNNLIDFLTEIADLMRALGYVNPNSTINPQNFSGLVSSCSNKGILEGSVTSLTTYATSIRQYSCAYCTSLQTINAPLVTTIGQQAFYGCTSLTTIDFPSLINMDMMAFYSCSSLTTVYLRANQVCTAANSCLPARSSQHINVYVPSGLISSYQTADVWKNWYKNGYIVFYGL